MRSRRFDGIVHLLLTEQQLETLIENGMSTADHPDAPLCRRIAAATRIRGGLPVAILTPEDIADLRAAAERDASGAYGSLFAAIIAQQPVPPCLAAL